MVKKIGRKPGGTNRCSHHIYTEEEKEYLRTQCKEYDIITLVKLFNKKFKRDKTYKAISSSLKRYGFKTGRTGRYEPGQEPANKGKRREEFMSAEGIKNSSLTRFKTGQEPINHRPVGSERVTVDGYIEIKIAEPRKWTHKHRVVYETAFGKIPKGMIITFLDGNKQNMELSNMNCITKAENLIMNRNKLYSKDPERTKTGVLIAKVMNKTNEITRRKI
jgi:hypothetical protein